MKFEYSDDNIIMTHRVIDYNTTLCPNTVAIALWVTEKTRAGGMFESRMQLEKITMHIGDTVWCATADTPYQSTGNSKSPLRYFFINTRTHSIHIAFDMEQLGLLTAAGGPLPCYAAISFIDSLGEPYQFVVDSVTSKYATH